MEGREESEGRGGTGTRTLPCPCHSQGRHRVPFSDRGPTKQARCSCPGQVGCRPTLLHPQKGAAGQAVAVNVCLKLEASAEIRFSSPTFPRLSAVQRCGANLVRPSTPTARRQQRPCSKPQAREPVMWPGSARLVSGDCRIRKRPTAPAETYQDFPQGRLVIRILGHVLE